MIPFLFLTHFATDETLPVFDFAVFPAIYPDTPAVTTDTHAHKHLSRSDSSTDLETTDDGRATRFDAATQAAVRSGHLRFGFERLPHNPTFGGRGFTPPLPSISDTFVTKPVRGRGRPRRRPRPEPLVGEGVILDWAPAVVGPVRRRGKQRKPTRKERAESALLSEKRSGDGVV